MSEQPTHGEIVRALASVYTVDQLTRAVELRRQTEISNQRAVDPFDTPDVCSPCDGACIVADGDTAKCDDS